jgi:hypothetical protein
LRSAVAAGDCACCATENIAILLSIKADLGRSGGAGIVFSAGARGLAGASTVSRYAAPSVVRSCAPQNNSCSHYCVAGQQGGSIGRDVIHSAPNLHRGARPMAKFIESSNLDAERQHGRMPGCIPQRSRWRRSANGETVAGGHRIRWVNRDDDAKLLAVAGQEVAQSLDRAGKVARPRQGDDPQVIRRGPIESGPLSDQDLLRQQQV